jgi:hypothetical protein
MALFLWLIILLSIAWGLADYQLQSRIEAPPPAVAPKPPPAPPVPPVADAPVAEDTPAAPAPPDPARD